MEGSINFLYFLIGHSYVGLLLLEQTTMQYTCVTNILFLLAWIYRQASMTTYTCCLWPTSEVQEPYQPGDVGLPSTRSHLHWLQGVCQRFPTSGRTSDHLQDCHPPKTASQLHRFLGMLNFYKRFQLHTAGTQAPLHDVLSGSHGRSRP
jgi:hypothetical protein